MVRNEKNSMMIEITYRVAILWILSFLGTIVHKVPKTWIVLHETRHTTPFGIYYCVEVVWIENHSHMLKITC